MPICRLATVTLIRHVVGLMLYLCRAIREKWSILRLQVLERRCVIVNEDSVGRVNQILSVLGPELPNGVRSVTLFGTRVTGTVRLILVPRRDMCTYAIRSLKIRYLVRLLFGTVFVRRRQRRNEWLLDYLLITFFLQRGIKLERVIRVIDSLIVRTKVRPYEHQLGTLIALFTIV